MVRIKGLFLVGLLFLSKLVAGQPLEPTYGLLHNTKEDSSLTFECREGKPGELNCEFNQTAVRRKLLNADAAKERDESVKAFRSVSKKEIEATCVETTRTSAVFDGRGPKDEVERARKLGEPQRREFKEQLLLFQRFCSDRSEANWMAIAQRDISKRLRTCQVSSNSFKQTFRKVSDPGTGQSAWVVKAEPEGPCGVVQLSRLEFDRTDKDYGFWVYSARKAITNPKAESFSGVRCGDLDQAEYLYDWRSREHPVECDYIEFSAL